MVLVGRTTFFGATAAFDVVLCSGCSRGEDEDETLVLYVSPDSTSVGESCNERLERDSVRLYV